jgi:hypothetical protein
VLRTAPPLIPSPYGMPTTLAAVLDAASQWCVVLGRASGTQVGSRRAEEVVGLRGTPYFASEAGRLIADAAVG